MTSSGKTTVTLPMDQQILITREFNAPKHLGVQGVDHARAGQALVERPSRHDGDLRDRPAGRRPVVSPSPLTGERTTLTLLVQTTSKELRDTIINSGMETGMQEQMDLLEQIAISLR